MMVVLALLAGALKWENRQLVQALDAHKQAAARLVHERDAAQQALTDWQAVARRNEQAQRQLRAQLDSAALLAVRRQQAITRLLNENARLREWSDSRLPDAVAGLHARPAFSGGEAYLRWLSARDAVQHSGKPAAH